MNYEILAHSKYMCKYHVVFIPKYRKKTLFVKVRPWLAERLKELAVQKGCRIESGEGGIMPDHVHNPAKPPVLPVVCDCYMR